MQPNFEELAPQNFSFNSPLGWCPACEGLGIERGTDQSALIANPNLTLSEGAVSAWPAPAQHPEFAHLLAAIAAACDIPLDVPWYQLDPRHQRAILYGTGERSIPVPADKTSGRAAYSIQYKGLYPALDEASRVSYDMRRELQDLIGERPCSVCHGDRIRADAAATRLGGLTLPQLAQLPLDEVLTFLESLELDDSQQQIAGDLLAEATHRLRFLIDVGLHYLNLNRGMPTLSGGESQRIRLAGQIGRALTGVLYVLDEPTIGLHPRDNSRLVEALERLRDLGNTVVIVEHDREIIEASDRLYDFGPGSGRYGGTIVAEGTPKQLSRRTKSSLTGAYLAGEKGIAVPRLRRVNRRDDAAFTPGSLTRLTDYESPPGGGWIELIGCRQNNLRNVTLQIPLGTLACVTGLSGSGKSSLIQETLARAVARHLNHGGELPGPHDELKGVERISRIITVDQQPIGATPASNPATYTGVFDPIRDLFSRLPDAKVRGFKPGRFSFNRAGGRCEDCEGLGQKKIEMHFLPDVWVTCETCRGHRYNQETLAVRYRGHSIADVLELSIGQALELFENIPKIRAPLATLCAIGLDYLTLGQSATTLSGGEAQRVKLSAELAKPNRGQTLYLLDEPTTGLHFDDIAKLLKVLNSLVEQGNTVVVIEHNLDVIKTADWIVDLGPEAGVGGGWIVASGTPEEVAAHATSYLDRLPTEANHKPRGKSKPPAIETPAPDCELPLRSWTGELLVPILEEQQRGDVEVFDAAEVARKREGDIDIARVGKDAPAPWQADGRRWHTQDRVARNGKSCRWEGAALEYVVDLLAKYKQLKKANWNDQARVEVTAKKKSGTGWFFHALTGDEWLVRFYFRVPKGTFDEFELQQSLALESVDDLDELPIYGRADRVRINAKKGPFQEVVLDVHWKKEIDTDAFRNFLEQAVGAYVGQVNRQAEDPEAIMPWKVLGRKWHLSRKGFPSTRRVKWNVADLEKLATLLEKTWSNASIDWTNKQVVQFRTADDEAPFAELFTKRRGLIELVVYVAPGAVPLGQITTLADDREVASHRSGRDAVKLRFENGGSMGAKELREALREMAPSAASK